MTDAKKATPAKKAAPKKEAKKVVAKKKEVVPKDTKNGVTRPSAGTQTGMCRGL